MNFINYKPGLKVKLEPIGSIPDQVHIFEEKQASAIDAALASMRPLLIRGETGIGKSQLARAAAHRLKRSFVHHVVDSQTEARDLFWELDTISRLAEAQIAGALTFRAESETEAAATHSDQVRQLLSADNFVKPGPLWWAFDWDSALAQAARSKAPIPIEAKGANPTSGTVVLIDEIDKAEPEVPNGLLEALGAGQFALPSGKVVSAQSKPPLIVITTNEERALPDAFIRRCLVLNLRLPTSKPELVALLVERGGAHFPKADRFVLETAAEMLVEDREAAIKSDRRNLPGQAEYLDLLRAVLTLYRSLDQQLDALSKLSEFTIRKHEL